MQVTDEMIDYIEGMQWDEDLKQDLYVKLLEMNAELDEPTNYISVMYNHLKWSTLSIEARRQELREQNRDQIIQNLALGGTGDDPADILGAATDLEQKLKDLSSLLRGTLKLMIDEGHTVEEIAAREKTTPNVIYQRVFQLKKLLGE